MKAVVVEIKNSFAAVLSDDGCISTIKNNNYEIGQVVQTSNPIVQFSKKIAVFAASAAAFVILGVGAWAYATPYTYVSVDVNPSIEYTVNRFNRVLTVKAMNDDGEEIINEISLDDLKNKTIEEALLQTVNQITASGYFTRTMEGGIVITTASKDDEAADKLATDLQLAVEAEISESEEDVIVEAYSVTLERVSEAKELGVTPGKLNLVEKLQASAADPTTINVEEWLDRPVKEIMKATKENRKASVVSGAAISFEDKEEQKNQAKEDKLKERDEQQLLREDAKVDKHDSKSNEITKEKNNSALEKAQETEDKAADKAKEADKKADHKAKKTNEKAKKTDEKASKIDKKSETAKDKIIDKSDRSSHSTNEDTGTPGHKETEQDKLNYDKSSSSNDATSNTGEGVKDDESNSSDERTDNNVISTDKSDGTADEDKNSDLSEGGDNSKGSENYAENTDNQNSSVSGNSGDDNGDSSHRGGQK